MSDCIEILRTHKYNYKLGGDEGEEGYINIFYNMRVKFQTEMDTIMWTLKTIIIILIIIAYAYSHTRVYLSVYLSLSPPVSIGSIY